MRKEDILDLARKEQLKERSFVAECIITEWCIGDFKWLREIEEQIADGTLDKPFAGWKGADAFLEKWKEVMESIDPIEVITKEV